MTSHDTTSFRQLFAKDDLEGFLLLQEASGLPFCDFLSIGDDSATSEEHPDLPPGTTVAINVTHPLLLMFLYGSERCCRHAVCSLTASELVTTRQPAGNILHALVAGSRA